MEGTGNASRVVPEIKVKFKEDYDKHLIDVEGFKGKTTIGIKGGHNFDNFKKYILENFTDQVTDFNQVIVSKNPHPSIEGIYEIKYQLPSYDSLSTANGGKGNFTGQWKEYKYPKTVYDPNVISDDQLLQWGREAMSEGLSSNRVIVQGGRSTSDLVEGIVNVNGKTLKFVGFKDKVTGEITNFYPVID